MKTISVIIPVYNAEKYLKKCVKSLLKQTYKNINIILVDDGSTDSSGKICDKFSEKYDNIRVIHKANGGAITARNTGIESLPEEGYTTFCDADDLMPLDGIEKLAELAMENDADIAVGTLQKFFGKGIRLNQCVVPSLQKRYVYENEEIEKKLYPSFFGITDFTGYMPTKLYKNEILKKSIDFECPVKHFQEDVAFNYQCVLLADKIAVMPDIVYYYRMGGSTSHFMPAYFEDCVSLYKFKIAQIDKNSFDENLRFTTAVELKNELFCWLQMYFEHYRKENNDDNILNEIKRCCELPAVKEAVNYPKEDSSGMPGFRQMVIENNYDSIYNMLQIDNKNGKLKRFLRNILIKL